MRTFGSVIPAALILSILLSCSGGGDAGGSESSEPIETYALTGEVVRVLPEEKIAVIKHDNIEGWMKAMTMEFPVKSDEDFAKLKPGARIEAKVYVQDLEFWIGDVTVLPNADNRGSATR